MKLVKSIRTHFELLALTAALFGLAFVPLDSTHFTICPISNLGIDFCPGCGLGRSISLLLRGEFQSSFEMHWLGLPALCIIIARIAVLIHHASAKAKLKREYNNKVTITDTL